MLVRGARDGAAERPKEMFPRGSARGALGGYGRLETCPNATGPRRGTTRRGETRGAGILQSWGQGALTLWEKALKIVGSPHEGAEHAVCLASRRKHWNRWFGP